MPLKIELYGLKLPEVSSGDDLAELILEAAEKEAGGLKKGDVLVVTSKVVSKALGLLVELDKIELSSKAKRIAKKTGGDPRHI